MVVVFQGCELVEMFVLLAGDLGVFQCEECFVWYALLSNCFLKTASVYHPLYRQFLCLDGLPAREETLMLSIVGQLPAYLQYFGGPLRCLVW